MLSFYLSGKLKSNKQDLSGQQFLNAQFNNLLATHPDTEFLELEASEKTLLKKFRYRYMHTFVSALTNSNISQSVQRVLEFLVDRKQLAKKREEK